MKRGPRVTLSALPTPTGSRLRLVSPRLQGLFDLNGPGQANLDTIQTCLDYSPEVQLQDDISTCEDPGHSEEWLDDNGDDEESLLSTSESGSPFDDKSEKGGEAIASVAA